MADRSYSLGTWNLEDLIPAKSGPEIEAVVKQLEREAEAFASCRAALAPSIDAATFASIVEQLEHIRYAGGRLNGYATLWLSEQTSDQAALAFRGRIDRLLADVKNRTLFFELWWKELDSDNAARLIEASGDVRYYLESLRRMAPYARTEAEEQIINLKNVHGVQALGSLYDMIANDLTFDVTIDGEQKTLTSPELGVYVRDPSPDNRAAAYQALHGTFGKHANVLGQIYNHIVGDWNDENVALRGMAAPISPRNLKNDLPDDVVDVLLETCRKNASVFHRYFRLKAGWLGMERLRRYDVYAPIETKTRAVSFEDAVAWTLESMSGFSPEMAELAERVLASDHLHSKIQRGKDSGAFCFGVVPDKTPWVLVNFTGRMDDAATLAHELGHAVHSMLAADHSVLTFRSSLPLAETASNFAEILLLKRMLGSEPDADVRRGLLAGFVDNSFASVLRQVYFVLFEREAHALISGEGATVDELSTRYFENLREQFADSVELLDEFRWEWVSVPHIYQVPFYCYAYAFGLLLVLGLYRQYEKEGEAFVSRYLKILSHGGSKAPMAILDEAGFDIRTEAFWQGGFDVINEMIDELERGTG
ncbi:M3 family oligoendopeptidase [Candidatus Bipolaricaulota bacterium]|nr:M3 family oligoendopeptidase [Candidatus Bipolaricaulota bacterium]